jgi:hypothetical protein
MEKLSGDIMGTPIKLERNAYIPSAFPSLEEIDRPLVSACAPQDATRAALERYIASIFHAAYGATVMEYLPLLCSLEWNHSYTAALGLRGATSGDLFCEKYLDLSIEGQARCEFARRVRRDEVMELGNLVASQPGQAVSLYLLVVRAMSRAGINYLVFAANRAVRASIRRCGFATRELCAADPGRLGEGAQEWGSYYEGQPMVVMADIREAVAHGQQRATIRQIWREHEDAIDELADAIHAYLRC